MAAISSLTTRSGKLRALSRAAIRMLGHDVDGEPTRIGDSLRTVCYIGAEDGGQTHGSDNGSARPGRARVAPARQLEESARDRSLPLLSPHTFQDAVGRRGRDDAREA